MTTQDPALRNAAAALVTRARAGDQNAIAMISEVRKSVPRSRKAAAAFDALCEYVRSNPIIGIGAEKAPSAGDVRVAVLGKVASAARSEKGYGEIPDLVSRLPTRTDCFEQAAHLVADGRPVNAGAILSILPGLQGVVMVEDGTDGSDWEIVSLEPLKIAARGKQVAVPLEDKHALATSMFATTFNNAGSGDRVVELGERFPLQHRQPIRVGYVMGLARLIQVIRAGGSPAKMSEMVGWELGT